MSKITLLSNKLWKQNQCIFYELFEFIHIKYVFMFRFVLTLRLDLHELLFYEFLFHLKAYRLFR